MSEVTTRKCFFPECTASPVGTKPNSRWCQRHMERARRRKDYHNLYETMKRRLHLVSQERTVEGDRAKAQLKKLREEVGLADGQREYYRRKAMRRGVALHILGGLLIAGAVVALYFRLMSTPSLL